MDIGNCEYSLKDIMALSTTGPELETGSLEIAMIDTFVLDTDQGDTYIVYNTNQLEFWVYGQLKLYIPCTATGNDVYIMDDGSDLSVYDSTGKVFTWLGGKKIIFSSELKVLDASDVVLFYI